MADQLKEKLEKYFDKEYRNIPLISRISLSKKQIAFEAFLTGCRWGQDDIRKIINPTLKELK